MGAIGRKRPVRRALQHRDVGIVFLDPANRFVNIIDVDPEMMQARNISRFSSNHGDADVAIADADRIVCPDRFFFFGGTRPGPLHAEHGLVEFGLAHEILTDDGRVLNSS